MPGLIGGQFQFPSWQQESYRSRCGPAGTRVAGPRREEALVASTKRSRSAGNCPGGQLWSLISALVMGLGVEW